tara:strand:+ start:3672 stop:4736 length:1065 start_codon:yes stop_codon:yes gene_type:complete
MKKYGTIYLDWDGVLWDFKQAFCDWHKLVQQDCDWWEFYETLHLTADEFHLMLSKLPQEFWQQEKYILPHAHKLVAWARANAEKAFVLTVAPEWDASAGKQNLARLLGLTVYTVATPLEKIEFAKMGSLLIDDKDTTVLRFAREISGAGGGYVWPTNYNQGLDHSWYFKKSWLEKVEAKEEVKPLKAHWALTDEDRNEMLRSHKKAGEAVRVEKPVVDKKPEPVVEIGVISNSFNDVWVKKPVVDEKPVLDYDAMDEAKKRKMTPMYSGLLAYFPDALAEVAQNSMVGHYQHNEPSEPMHWDREKSADELDAIIRHIADHSKSPRDKDGTLHMTKVVWRALAFVQKYLEEENNG